MKLLKIYFHIYSLFLSFCQRLIFLKWNSVAHLWQGKCFLSKKNSLDIITTIPTLSPPSSSSPMTGKMSRKPSSNTAAHFESFLQAATTPDYDHHTKIDHCSGAGKKWERSSSWGTNWTTFDYGHHTKVISIMMRMFGMMMVRIMMMMMTTVMMTVM